MNFQFASLGDFLYMSGHGPFVWSCYIVTAIALVYLVVRPLRARRRFMAEQKRQQAIQSRTQSQLETAG